MIPAGNVARMSTSRLPALSSDAWHLNKIKTTKQVQIIQVERPGWYHVVGAGNL